MTQKQETFPWYASVSESLNLEVFVNSDQLSNRSAAFCVHPTNELPMKLLPEDTFEFSGGWKLEVFITASGIKADESLKTLNPSDRSCYFEGERKLAFFKIYTKHNCEIECFSNYSREKCNCVPFDIVRDPEIRVCGVSLEDDRCNFLLRSSFRKAGPTGKLDSCSCLSTCESIGYDIEIRESKLRVDQFANMTQLSFQFEGEDFYPLRRTRQFTFVDFLSNVGGLLGLFAGISVLSLFECFYFFTSRVLTNLLVLRKHNHHTLIEVRPAK